MADAPPERGKAVVSPVTLADTCTDFIAANVGNLRGLVHPDRDLFMHAEVAEALVERISARGDMDDEAIAHFNAAHTRYVVSTIYRLWWDVGASIYPSTLQCPTECRLITKCAFHLSAIGSPE